MSIHVKKLTISFKDDEPKLVVHDTMTLDSHYMLPYSDIKQHYLPKILDLLQENNQPLDTESEYKMIVKFTIDRPVYLTSDGTQTTYTILTDIEIIDVRKFTFKGLLDDI